MVRRLSVALGFSVCFLLSASFASANSVELLTFASLQNGQLVGNFYDGAGLPAAPNLGITFSSNFYGLRPISQGGGGNFSSTPFGTPAIFIAGTTGVPVTGTMNVTNGFGAGINFYYTAAFQETVTVWSGANGTSTVLAMMTLSTNDANCTAVAYCNWTNAGLAFSGTAGSVTFSGPANGIGLATITLGQSTTAVPEPSSIYLLGTGLIGLCAQGIRRFGRN